MTTDRNELGNRFTYGQYLAYKATKYVGYDFMFEIDTSLQDNVFYSNFIQTTKGDNHD